MSRSRAPLALGLAAASGIGYYLYSAGGNPRIAERQAEADAHRAASKIRGEAHDIKRDIRGDTTSAERGGVRLGKEAGSKIDSAVNTIHDEASRAKHEAEVRARQAKVDTLKKIDEFDRTVEEKAAKSKSYLSSWFGSK
ncbi:hypothetical protein QBC35DRAFT_403415 [Podospora australis]|uniref:Calcofluor white hypersensitive protein n=1 Tax=Podospora australis TaxID=1536484 RepID=A0AAN6WYI0_9PEZI|nr:hypothetical protein QBC35DRAFT_403415 [Podospora australis]